jgi:hypothetical protein
MSKPEWLEAEIETMSELMSSFAREKSVDVFDISSIKKDRVYVDSPDKVPEQYEVQEGEEGGLYYETEGTSETDTSDPVDAASNVSVDKWPEEHAILSAEQVQQTTASNIERTDPEVASDFVNNFDGFQDETTVSAWRFKENDIMLRPGDAEETIAHEMGHGALGVYGVTVSDQANMFAHFYQGEVPEMEFGQPVPDVAEQMADKLLDNPDAPEEKKEEVKENLEEIRERYGETTLEREDMYLFIDESQMDVEPSDQIRELAEAVNVAWDRQIEAAKDDEMDEGGFIIGQPYSSTNPHETMSMTHETLMGDVADPHAIENLYRRQPELLDAWTNVFEPRSIQADILNQLYDEFGPNEAFEDVPYPEHQGVLEE